MSLRDRAAFAGAQDASAMAGIEPRLDAVAESPVVFAFGLGAPRQPMMREPRFALFCPFVAKARRHSIREADGDEVSRARLLPMRQAMPRVAARRMDRKSGVPWRRGALAPSYINQINTGRWRPFSFLNTKSETNTP